MSDVAFRTAPPIGGPSCLLPLPSLQWSLVWKASCEVVNMALFKKIYILQSKESSYLIVVPKDERLVSLFCCCFKQSTYKYGEQLLKAALVLRRSLRFDLEPNNRQMTRLSFAWKLFSRGVNERTVRQNSVTLFVKHSDMVRPHRATDTYLS